MAEWPKAAVSKLAEDGLDAITPSRFHVTTMKGNPSLIIDNFKTITK